MLLLIFFRLFPQNEELKSYKDRVSKVNNEVSSLNRNAKIQNKELLKLREEIKALTTELASRNHELNKQTYETRLLETELEEVKKSAAVSKSKLY